MGERDSGNSQEVIPNPVFNESGLFSGYRAQVQDRIGVHKSGVFDDGFDDPALRGWQPISVDRVSIREAAEKAAEEFLVKFYDTYALDPKLLERLNFQDKDEIKFYLYQKLFMAAMPGARLEAFRTILAQSDGQTREYKGAVIKRLIAEEIYYHISMVLYLKNWLKQRGAMDGPAETILTTDKLQRDATIY